MCVVRCEKRKEKKRKEKKREKKFSKFHTAGFLLISFFLSFFLFVLNSKKKTILVPKSTAPQQFTPMSIGELSLLQSTHTHYFVLSYSYYFA